MAQPLETGPVLPALAAAVAEWFPDLGGRSIAVSEAEITKDNVPTLPLAMVALVHEENGQRTTQSNIDPELTETIALQFWIAPARYKRADNSESPFWAFYDYETLRDKLMAELGRWCSPRGGRVLYRRMDVESDALAVVITFTLAHSFVWCEPIEPLCFLRVESRVVPAIGRVCTCEPPVPDCPKCNVETWTPP